jgi:hypothetical protein
VPLLLPHGWGAAAKISSVFAMACGSICDNMQQGQWTYAPRPVLATNPNRYNCCDAKARDPGAICFRIVGMAQMATLTFGGCKPDTTPPRGVLLRVLDRFAEWQMRHSHSVIRRIQRDAAVIDNVAQPSSVNDRSSISPCDR